MYVVWLYGISYTLLGRTRGHGHPPLNVALCHRQHWKIQIPQLSSLYVNLYFSDRKIHLTHVNISDFDTELRLVPLKCGCLVRILRVCDGSLSTTDARDMSVYRKLSELLCSLELIHLGNDISPPVRSAPSHCSGAAEPAGNSGQVSTWIFTELQFWEVRRENEGEEEQRTGPGLWWRWWWWWWWAARPGRTHFICHC